MSRNGFRCFECDAKAHHAHHIVPRTLGGRRTIPLCHGCHSKVHKLDFTQHSKLTKIGIEKAREAGKTIGRPIVEVDFQRVHRLRKRGFKDKDIIRKMQISKSTFYKYVGRRKE